MSNPVYVNFTAVSDICEDFHLQTARDIHVHVAINRRRRKMLYFVARVGLIRWALEFLDRIALVLVKFVSVCRQLIWYCSVCVCVCVWYSEVGSVACACVRSCQVVRRSRPSSFVSKRHNVMNVARKWLSWTCYVIPRYCCSGTRSKHRENSY